MISFFKYFFENANEEKAFPVTTSKFKVDVIAKENNFIKKYFTPSPNDQLVGVVGRVEGLLRHIQQFRDLGYQDKNMLIFELDEGMYKDLENGDGIHKGIIQLKNDNITNANLFWGNLLKPSRTEYYDQYKWFDSKKVTHADLDFTIALNEPQLFDEMKQAFSVYPNLKSAVFVHSLRAHQTKSAKATKELNDKYRKLIDTLDVVVGRSSEFKNIYDYYTSETEGRKSGKGLFIEQLRNLFPSAAILIQSYAGASTKEGKTGGAMISFTVVKDASEPVINAEDSIFLETDLTATDIKEFPRQYSSFMGFYEKGTTIEGFDQNNEFLKSKGKQPLTEQDYNDFEDLMTKLYNYFLQKRKK